MNEPNDAPSPPIAPLNDTRGFSLDLRSLAQIGKFLARYVTGTQPDPLRELQIERARLELEQLTGNLLSWERVPFADLIGVPTVSFVGARGSGKTAAALALAQQASEKLQLPLKTNIRPLGATSFKGARDCVYLWDDPVKPEKGRDAALSDALQHARHYGVTWIVTAPLPSAHNLDVLRYTDAMVFAGVNRAQMALNDLPEPWSEMLQKTARLWEIAGPKSLMPCWITSSTELVAVPRPALPDGWSPQISTWCR